MSYFRRSAMLGLLALLVTVAPLTALAQGDAIRIDGSRIVASITEPISSTYAEETGATVNFEISGTGSGLDRLCNGEIDIANAASPISRAEALACENNNIEWVEVLLAYDAVAIVTNPSNSFAQCLTLGEVTTLFGPSATGAVMDWSQVRPNWEAVRFELYAPASSSSVYNLLDSLLPGDGLRTDFSAEESAEAALAMVAGDVAGLAIVPLNTVLQSEANVMAVALDDLSGNGCVTPEAATVEDGTYVGARSLYAYVNAESLARDEVKGLVEALASDDAHAVAADNGFMAPGANADKVREIIADGLTGRQFSFNEPLYAIPLDLTGTVSTQSAAAAYRPLNAVGNAFTAAYTGATIDAVALGNAAAYRDLCSGAVDIGGVTRSASDSEAAVCADNNVALWEVQLGNQATVMVVPADADYASCLTTDQITALWQDQGEDTVTNWSQLGDEFPDLAVSIFLPLDGSSMTDFILFQSSGKLLNARRDAVESRNDGNYRAAATANVEGAISYLTYGQFLAQDANVMPVAVDAGDGCVNATDESIRDGSYLLSRPILMAVNEAALVRPEVQSFVWYALRDASTSLLESTDVFAVEAEAFESYRTEALSLITAAESATAE